MTFGQPTAALAATEGLVVITPSGDMTGATDYAAIQQALSDVNRQVLLSPGEFYINQPIVMRSNQRLIGAGAQATKVIQVGAGHGIVSVSSFAINYVTIAGLSVIGQYDPSAPPPVNGPSGIYLIPGPAEGPSNITIEDCVVRNWGDCGVYLTAAIASRITRVQCAKNGGNGFYVTKTANAAATSIAFEACYALDNKKNGYELDYVSYSTLNACANDGGRRGYALYNCSAVTLTSCGAEVFTEAGFLLRNSRGCSLFGPYTFKGAKTGIHIGTATLNLTIGGAVQSDPSSATVPSLTNYILSEAGSSAVIWGVTRTSPNSLAGKVTNLDGSA
ncbi:right-handed parallel beta-helix repeat-containing protein [Salinispora tropica]|uniref:right-handed parallel beta-helix repeat-containing protein n=1 Tax=Salinispora tropica TaxID=168695 RepID=UPI0003630403|nr:right-handed parallel beta-helix repeat-containing protein [Salinispora tropica]